MGDVGGGGGGDVALETFAIRYGDVWLILYLMSSLCLTFAFLGACTKTFSTVEHQFGIMTTVLRDKVQKKLNISPDANSLSPMFNLGSSVHTPVALEHFDLGFVEVRRF